MTMLEISLAQAYLAQSGHDPVTALIRSVRDLARMRQLLGSRLDLEIASAARQPLREIEAAQTATSRAA